MTTDIIFRDNYNLRDNWRLQGLYMQLRRFNSYCNQLVYFRNFGNANNS